MPPSDDPSGASFESALAAPGTPTTAVGGSGVVRGVMDALGWLGRDLPASFVAVTVNV